MLFHIVYCCSRHFLIFLVISALYLHRQFVEPFLELFRNILSSVHIVDFDSRHPPNVEAISFLHLYLQVLEQYLMFFYNIQLLFHTVDNCSKYLLSFHFPLHIVDSCSRIPLIVLAIVSLHLYLQNVEPSLELLCNTLSLFHVAQP